MHTLPSFDPTSAHAHAQPAAPQRRLVTDAPTRMFHWLFALSFLGAYLTAEGEHWRLLHVTLGYTMAGLLAFRVLYGVFGPRTASLGLLWRKLAGAPAWLRSLPQTASLRQVNWRQGQNLLMVLAVVALLVIVVPLTLSGYATYNDWGNFLGGNWVEEVHEFLGEAILFVVLAHMGLIAVLSVLRRKNQALPMLTGRVQGPGPDLAKGNHGWLAAAVLACVLAFWAWQWDQAPELPAADATRWSENHHDDDD